MGIAVDLELKQRGNVYYLSYYHWKSRPSADFIDAGLGHNGKISYLNDYQGKK